MQIGTPIWPLATNNWPLFMCIVLIAGGASNSFAGPRNIQPGDSVGPLKANTLSGESITSAQWSGRPSVWIFISPRQASSESALIALQKAVDAIPPPGVGAVALTGDASQLPELREFASRHRIRIPIAIDAGRETYGRLGVIVQPTTLLIDSAGKLHAAIPGFDPAFEHALRARLLFLTGKMTEADMKKELAASQPARNMQRELAERLTHSASIMLGRGLRAEAVKELENAVAADAKYAPAHLDLALLKLADKDTQAAESRVNLVLAFDPHNRRVRLVQGVIRLQQNKLDEAVTLLEEAAMLNPDPALTQYWLGRAHEARGEKDKAATCFRLAAERLLSGPDAEVARGTQRK